MEVVDMVLVSDEGVVEHEGIIKKLGAYALAICAKEHGIPFYAASLSQNYARLYPLHQRDLPVMMGRLAELDFVDTTCWHVMG
jgi:translation initiation factor 2B subunit (eIF-2B alpha/beta/delta family)